MATRARRSNCIAIEHVNAHGALPQELHEEIVIGAQSSAHIGFVNSLPTYAVTAQL